MLNEMLIDLVMIMLSTAVGVYCALLHRRLGKLRSGQADMQSAIATFDKAAEQINAALARADAAGSDGRRTAARERDDAQALLNELSVMVAAGSRVADRLEHALADVRAVGNRGLARADKEAA